ncbi:MAG: hypothetical protein AB1422_08160 [bacterium]
MESLKWKVINDLGAVIDPETGLDIMRMRLIRKRKQGDSISGTFALHISCEKRNLLLQKTLCGCLSGIHPIKRVTTNNLHLITEALPAF